MGALSEAGLGVVAAELAQGLSGLRIKRIDELHAGMGVLLVG